MSMEIVLLGTGSPLPSATRCGAGQIIIAGEERVLVDCGWGAARRLYGAGVPVWSINTVCFTHMHSDHISDFADFLIIRWTGGAKRPLTVFGPEGTRETVEGFLAALGRDVRYRMAHHGSKLSPEGILVEVHEVPATFAPHEAARLGDLVIESFEVDHFPVVPALGYRFTRQDKRLVLSGDTRMCDALIEASRGADLLVSEAVNVEMLNQQIAMVRGMNATAASLLEDVESYHAPTLDVAKMANAAGVRKLVISHVIPPVAEEGDAAQAFVRGMSDIYAGPLVLGRDMQRFTV